MWARPSLRASGSGAGAAGAGSGHHGAGTDRGGDPGRERDRWRLPPCGDEKLTSVPPPSVPTLVRHSTLCRHGGRYVSTILRHPVGRVPSGTARLEKLALWARGGGSVFLQVIILSLSRGANEHVEQEGADFPSYRDRNDRPGRLRYARCDGPCDTVVDWKHNSSFSAYHYDHNGGSHPEPNPLFVEADRWENQTNWHASLQLGRSWDHIIPDSEQAHQGCSHN
jgi:hypothetical protein